MVSFFDSDFVDNQFTGVIPSCVCTGAYSKEFGTCITLQGNNWECPLPDCCTYESGWECGNGVGCSYFCYDGPCSRSCCNGTCCDDVYSSCVGDVCCEDTNWCPRSQPEVCCTESHPICSGGPNDYKCLPPLTKRVWFVSLISVLSALALLGLGFAIFTCYRRMHHRQPEERPLLVVN